MSPDPQHPSPAADHPSAPSLGHPTDRETWIAQLEQRLVQCERLASIGELSSTTTHEFNNILMTILNYAKLGLRHKDDATRDKALSRILDAANRGAKITSTVLGLSRARATPPEPTNLVTLVDDTLVLLERELMKYRIDVVKEFSPTPEILASTNQLQRLLLNLITNARQAIGENGTILIRIAHEPKSNAVVFTVRDNGKGIPAEVLPRIFEPFFTTKQGPDATGKGGTGLGLSACKEIVDEHRGRIRVESTVGKGTSFTIRFPAIQSSAASGPTAQAS
jgi:signal transduction histidine kinase